ncbi:MAG TPA: glutamate synthase [Coriobacteriia bacterium]|nr:glutamate synthase [Coriobacteriia bacterium]
MVISSLVVETFPDFTADIQKGLSEIDKVEVHDVNDNKIVVTIEADSVDESHAIANSFVAFEGVVNVNLIYANFEDDPDIAKAASR